MTSRLYDRLLSLLSVVGFLCWCFIILGPPKVPARGLDFRIFYTAAALPLEDLYKLDRQIAFQRELWKQYGRFVPSPFPRPAFYALLLKPLRLLDYTTALHLWLALLIAAFIGAALLVRKLYGAGLGIFFLLVSYYPVSVALRNGQDISFVLLLLLLGVYFFRGGREWAAALCLAVAFEKFNLVFLVPVALLLHGKKSWVWKLAACGAGLAALSLALVGVSGFRQYLGMLSGGSLDALFYDAWNLRSLVWRFGGNPVVLGVVTAACAAWFVWLSRRVEWDTAFWLAVGFSALVSWHSYSYDYAVSLPMFYLLWARHRVYLALPFLAGGLWPHLFLMQEVSWAVSLLVLAASVELAIRSRARVAA
jgi:hypothetical protein